MAIIVNTCLNLDMGQAEGRRDLLTRRDWLESYRDSFHELTLTTHSRQVG